MMNAEAGASRAPVHRRDYSPPAFLVEQVDLLFDLYDDHVTVRNAMTLRRGGPEKANLVLDGGQDMELLSLSLDGSPLPDNCWQRDGEILTISNPPECFELIVETRIRPQENTRLEGLYRSNDMFCTQCEAEGFRHITFYPDRPDVMAKFRVRLEADKATCPVLLSNGNPGASGALADNRHFAEWNDPWPKPSYLFALVAGDLVAHSGSFTTREGHDVVLNVWVRESDLDKCEHALLSLIKSMQWDEDVYGLCYDLDVYNIVAVSDFNMGAMENKGLNVFNTKYVLASTATATDTDFGHVEAVIGHEYFHNWTGNRVTCRDWFQLSLKEGLTVFRDQEFSADLGSRGIKRIDDVSVLRGAQFPEDAGPLAHPVRPDSYVEINNFYTATVYNKGAEVIRMMHLLIGAEAFHRGMELYFERHDGTAVTCEDFVRAMEDASGFDLGRFRRWYSQAGTPVVTAEWTRAHEDHSFELTIRQSTAPTPAQSDKMPLHIPLRLAFFGDDGGKWDDITLPAGARKIDVGEYLLEITEAKEVFRFGNLSGGVNVSLLRGFSAPVVLRSWQGREEKINLLGLDDDPFVKWDTAQSVAAELIFDISEGHGSQNIADQAAGFVAAVQASLVDERLDPALRAVVATLPGENFLLGQREDIDIDALYSARQALQAHLDQCLAGDWQALYQQFRGSAGADLSSAAIAGRRLANTALAALARGKTGDWEALCINQFEQSDNMTDRLAALGAIVSSDSSHREQLLNHFHDEWSDDELVMDKWFMLQATADRAGVLDDVVRLASHDAFSLSNPNRARSLVAGFAMANVAHFHDATGRGYDFLAEMICKIDDINPQLAARLVPPLGRWKKFDKGRQALMKAALGRIIERPGCSADVAELGGLALGE